MKKGINRSRFGNLTAMAFLLVFGAVVFLPTYYTVISAFKPLNELFIFPPRFWVGNPTLQNFSGILTAMSQSEVPLERYVFNTVFVSVSVTVVYVLIAAMAGYAMAKLALPCKGLLYTVIVFAIMFRGEVTELPQYILMAKMGILDTYWALILPLLSTSFGVFLMMQFTESVPIDILEAARIDGAGEKRIFFSIVLPAIKPAVMTIAILTFISAWNAAGSKVIFSEEMKPLTTLLQQLNTGGISRTGISGALSVMMLLPPVTLYFVCQNMILDAMAYSGIKS